MFEQEKLSKNEKWRKVKSDTSKNTCKSLLVINLYTALKNIGRDILNTEHLPVQLGLSSSFITVRTDSVLLQHSAPVHLVTGIENYSYGNCKCASPNFLSIRYLSKEGLSLPIFSTTPYVTILCR